MTDSQKLKIIDSIITCAYEFKPHEPDRKGAYFEAIVSMICAVLTVDDELN